MDAIFDAVDVAGIATFIGATGLLIVGAYLAMKGIDVAKKAIGKA